MLLFELLGICGIAFIILEIFVTSMFFLNFALASFITAILALFIVQKYILVIVFFVFSFVSFAFLRPILKKKLSKKQETGMNSKYIGNIAKAETEINEFSGAISIYGERWEARSESGIVIKKDAEVVILRNESIIMYVDEYKKEF